jgi:hypothetical protein
VELNPASLFMLALGAGAVGVVLHFTLWRAWLFVKPQSMIIEPDEPAEKMNLPGVIEAIAEDLEKFGFKAIGTHYEKPRFTKETVSYDYANTEKKVFATIYEGRDGGARMYLLTPIKCPDGSTGFVVTANYRRPAREIGRCYYSGGLEDYATERVLKAHLRRVENEKLEPIGEFNAEGRITAARAWFAGFGRTEVRAQNLHGLLWSAGAVAMLVSGIIRFLS